MGRTALESLQGPLTHLDLANPEARIALLHATGILDFADPNCQFPPTGENDNIALLHPKVGGHGMVDCSGDRLVAASCHLRRDAA